MITKIIRARSFYAVSNYLLHDKRATTSERVEWAEMENLDTDHREEAWREMKAIAGMADTLKAAHGRAATGRKRVNPACHLCLSWAKDERPDKEEMMAAGREALKALGLEDHQALIVCHNDEPQPHIHLLVNRINRENGITNTLSHSKRKLSEWALDYEKRQGKIRCEKRAENNESLKKGEKPRYRNQVVNDAWNNSKTGLEFRDRLAEQGYTLARGSKRIVVVDREGKSSNPTRDLHGVKAKELREKLADLDIAALPSADDLKRERSGEDQKGKRPQSGEDRKTGEPRQEAETWDRDQAEADWQIKLVDQAISEEEQRRKAEGQARQEEDGGEKDKGGRGAVFNRASGAAAERREQEEQERRVALHSAQVEERIAFGEVMAREYDRQRRELEAFYDVREKREELAKLEAKPRLRLAEQEHAQNLHKSIGNAEQRKEEALRALERKRERELDQFEREQAIARESLERQLAARKTEGQQDRGEHLSGRAEDVPVSLDFNQESGAMTVQNVKALEERLEFLYAEQTQDLLAFEQNLERGMERERRELKAFYDPYRNGTEVSKPERDALDLIEKRAQQEKQAFTLKQRTARETAEQALDEARQALSRPERDGFRGQPERGEQRATAGGARAEFNAKVEAVALQQPGETLRQGEAVNDNEKVKEERRLFLEALEKQREEKTKNIAERYNTRAEQEELKRLREQEPTNEQEEQRIRELIRAIELKQARQDEAMENLRQQEAKAREQFEKQYNSENVYRRQVYSEHKREYDPGRER